MSDFDHWIQAAEGLDRKAGRVRMRIGDGWFVVEPGDSYCHPAGAVHQHEALEDAVRIEGKTFSGGGFRR